MEEILHVLSLSIFAFGISDTSSENDPVLYSVPVFVALSLFASAYLSV